MKAVSFVPGRDHGLDEIADKLRRSARARVRARGLPVTEVIDVFFAEQASRTGGR